MDNSKSEKLAAKIRMMSRRRSDTSRRCKPCERKAELIKRDSLRKISRSGCRQCSKTKTRG
jgi:hypothetical protein